LAEKARLVYWSIFLLVAGVFPLCIGIFVQSIWAILVLGSWLIILCYMAYLRLVKKREPRYPLVPPEGKPDIYTIVGPRPVYEDMEQHPWLFKEKRKKKRLRTKKVKKKH